MVFPVNESFGVFAKKTPPKKETPVETSQEEMSTPEVAGRSLASGAARLPGYLGTLLKMHGQQEDKVQTAKQEAFTRMRRKGGFFFKPQPDYVPPEPEGPGILEKVGAAIEGVTEESSQAWAESVPEQYRRSLVSYDEAGEPVFDWSTMSDPKWWTYNSVNFLPELVATIGTGAGAGMMAARLGASTRLAKLSGALVGGVIGGWMEGSQTYNDMIDKGAEPEDAKRAAILMTMGSGALNSVALSAWFSKLPKNVAMKFVAQGGRAALESITEYLEEPVSMAAKALSGEVKSFDEYTQDLVLAVNVMPPAFAMSLFVPGANIIGDRVVSDDKILKEAFEEEDTPESITDRVFEKAGIPEKQEEVEQLSQQELLEEQEVEDAEAAIAPQQPEIAPQQPEIAPQQDETQKRTIVDDVEDFHALEHEDITPERTAAQDVLRARLKPAVQLQSGEVVEGKVGEVHDEIIERLEDPSVSSRGYVDKEEGFLRGEDQLILDSSDLMTDEEANEWLLRNRAKKEMKSVKDFGHAEAILAKAESVGGKPLPKEGKKEYRVPVKQVHMGTLEPLREYVTAPPQNKLMSAQDLPLDLVVDKQSGRVMAKDKNALAAALYSAKKIAYVNVVEGTVPEGKGYEFDVGTLYKQGAQTTEQINRGTGQVEMFKRRKPRKKAKPKPIKPWKTASYNKMADEMIKVNARITRIHGDPTLYTRDDKGAVDRFGEEYVDQLHQAAAELGHSIVWFQQNNTNAGTTGGMVISKAPVGRGGGGARPAIMLNTDVDFEHPNQVLGHEMIHMIRANNPELYNEFERVAKITEYAQKKSKHNYWLKRGFTPENVRMFKEEVSGDYLGNMLNDRKFLEAIAKEDPTFAVKLFTEMKRLLKKIKAVFLRYNLLDRNFKKQFLNSEQMFDAAVKMVSKYRAGRSYERSELKEKRFTADYQKNPPARETGPSLVQALSEMNTGFREGVDIDPKTRVRLSVKEENRKLSKLDTGDTPTGERTMHVAFESGNAFNINKEVIAAAKNLKPKALLNIDANAKTIKGQKEGFMTGVMYLSPEKSSGYQVCPKASAGCIAACLNTAGRGAFDSTQRARKARTLRFFDNRDQFLKDVYREIEALGKKAKRKGLVPVVRLNGTSDLPWEKFKLDKTLGKTIFEHFPDVQFYDYTKIHQRAVKFGKGEMPDNYHITFSRAEDNDADAIKVLEANGNVAVVFRQGLPAKWKGFDVINGDSNDLRFRDEPGTVVGLVAKGKGKKETSGFVVDVPENEIVWKPERGKKLVKKGE